MGKRGLGLALGEGGARGLAHIGVLQVLQDHDIPVDHVAGTSIGAVVGAMYAETLDAYLVQDRFEELAEREEHFTRLGLRRFVRGEKREASFWDMIGAKIMGTLALNLAQTRRGLLKAERLEQTLEGLLHIRHFSECRIPFVALATDISWGKETPLCTGNLIRAVTASAAIPGFFTPVEHDGLSLSDGAICCPLPVPYAEYAEEAVTMGVAVPTSLREKSEPENAIDIMLRAQEVNMHYFTSRLMERANVALYPDIGDVQWHEMDRIREMVQAGREAAEAAIPEIKDELERRSGWFRLR
ncbi:MAG: patatin-like phospholipase family protein [Desulfohalobiaceae bacterium]